MVAESQHTQKNNFGLTIFFCGTVLGGQNFRRTSVSGNAKFATLMEKGQYERLRDNLVEICSQVDPKEILPYLKCLTVPDREYIQCQFQNYGRTEAARNLVDTLRRRTNSYQQFRYALMEMNYESLVEKIDPEYHRWYTGVSRRQTSNGVQGNVVPISQSGASNITISNPEHVNIQIGENNEQTISHSSEGTAEVFMIERIGDEDTGEGNAHTAHSDHSSDAVQVEHREVHAENSMWQNSLNTATDHQKRNSTVLNIDPSVIIPSENHGHPTATQSERDIPHNYQQARSSCGEEKLSNPIQETEKPECEESVLGDTEVKNVYIDTEKEKIEMSKVVGTVEKPDPHSTGEALSGETGYDTEESSLEDETALKCVASVNLNQCSQNEGIIPNTDYSLKAKMGSSKQVTVQKKEVDVFAAAEIRERTQLGISDAREIDQEDSITVVKRRGNSTTAKEKAGQTSPRVKVTQREQQLRSIPKPAELSLHIPKDVASSGKPPDSGNSDCKRNVSPSALKYQAEATGDTDRDPSYCTRIDENEGNTTAESGKDPSSCTDIDEKEGNNTAESDEDSVELSLDSITVSESSDVEEEQHATSEMGQSEQTDSIVPDPVTTTVGAALVSGTHGMRSDVREMVFRGRSQVVSCGAVGRMAGEIVFQTDNPEVQSESGAQIHRDPECSYEDHSSGNVARHRKKATGDGLVKADGNRNESNSAVIEEGSLKGKLSEKESVQQRQHKVSDNRARDRREKLAIGAVCLLIGFALNYCVNRYFYNK